MVVAVAVGADEGEGIFFVLDEVVAHPGLAALHLIDGVEQIGAWAPGWVAGARAEIVDREAVVGGLFQVEVAERRVGPGSESICLGDADFAGLLPVGDTVRFDVELLGQRLRGKVDAFARPAEYAWLECDLEAAAGRGLGHWWISSKGLIRADVRLAVRLLGWHSIPHCYCRGMTGCATVEWPHCSQSPGRRELVGLVRACEATAVHWLRLCGKFRKRPILGG